MNAETAQTTKPATAHPEAAKRRPSKVTTPTSKSDEKPAEKATPRPQSKQDRVLNMLRQKDGATVAAVMKATGWQKHSVHGFLAGIVRKKLGLNLVVEKSDSGRIYRIVADLPTKAGRKTAGRRANS